MDALPTLNYIQIIANTDTQLIIAILLLLYLRYLQELRKTFTSNSRAYAGGF